MSLLELPLSPGTPSYSEQVTLDGALYTLRIRWNTRMSAWFLEIYDTAEVLLVPPRRCVVGAPLLDAFRYRAGSPPGNAIVFDTTQRQVDPGLDDFGTRVLLLYREAVDSA